MLYRSFLLAMVLTWAAPGADAAPRGAGVKSTAGKSVRITFEKDVMPFLNDYCFGCHGNGKSKGDITLDQFKNTNSILADRKLWERVLENLRNQSMPPEHKKQPLPARREDIAGWIESLLFNCDCTKPDPGRVTVRRLNRTEYDNTLRDLVGVDFKPAEDFPADDSGYGFDNIGDALSMPPVLLEKYLSAAQKILDAAIVTGDPARLATNVYEAANLEGSSSGGPLDGGARMLGREGDIFVRHAFPCDGDYILRARAWGEQAGPEPPRMRFSVDGEEQQTFDVKVEAGSPQDYEIRLRLRAGRHKFAAAYLNNYNNRRDPNPKNRDRNLIIEHFQFIGPFNATPPPLPASHARIFSARPEPGRESAALRETIGRFARRAYRRPLAGGELDRLVALAERARRDGESFEISVSVALQAVLVSPHFLFRGELQPEPDNPRSVHPINEFALASRLSYFLWSSLPDEELLSVAEKGALRKNLEAQVTRMLRDPKAGALVENFAGQWLQLRNLKLVTPDRVLFPDFDEELRTAMQRETELLFETIIREDRPVLDFLTADYTFLNERLARHYGIEGVRGQEFRRVTLKDRRRGGVLTHASFLTITSNPTRTSPVKRGKWVLENILGTPPPPPPPDVPELDEGKGKQLTGSLRQRMEQHRENPTCASCHQRMDPIGFGFEHFNGIGQWREQDGQAAIDPAGQLNSGEKFSDAADLRAVLATKKRQEYLRCLTEKMLTYALGRGVEYYDKCATEEILAQMKRGKYRFSSLVLGVVKSTPFQKRRGEGDRLLQQAAR